MLDFLLELNKHRNKRHFAKEKIKNIDFMLEREIRNIEEDPEKNILTVLNKDGEHIIVYRYVFYPEEKYGMFYIALKVINKRGIVLNRIRLSANYIDGETLEICDIEVFGENEGRGYGSILLQSLINFAQENSVNTITGWISQTDKNHFDKLDYFYKKHGFSVIWGNNSVIANNAADILWRNT